MGIGITHLGSVVVEMPLLSVLGGCNVLVDCGFSLKQTEKRLGIAGFEPSSIDSIVVTHHHKITRDRHLGHRRSGDRAYTVIW